MNDSFSIIFQSAKLGDIPQILVEIDWANNIFSQNISVERIYGVSGGCIAAVGYALQTASMKAPETWGRFSNALLEIKTFLQASKKRELKRININPRFGFYNLNPLRKWLENFLETHGCPKDIKIGSIPAPLYLCAADQDGLLTLFGKECSDLQMHYHFVKIFPPQDTILVDALIAALSTLLSTEPALVNKRWYRDCRPAFVDLGAIVADLEQKSPRKIIRSRPHAPIHPWKLNAFTSSFIMHSQNERNHGLLSSYYLDLLQKNEDLKKVLNYNKPSNDPLPIGCPSITHIQLPYVGSTEAATNMRQSVLHKESLIEKFNELLKGQINNIPFDQPANVIYGAGGFSGILAGLVTTKAITEGFKNHSGQIKQIYGVSAGVLNGFFHAIQLAATRYPDLYTSAANNALKDLEEFLAKVKPEKIVKMNRNPFSIWHGLATLEPLEKYLVERLKVYTGSEFPEQITFDAINLPLTIAVARSDGFTDFLGMATTGRKMHFAGRSIEVLPGPIIKSILAGWSMNTYIVPANLHGQQYRDGGGTFYDIGIFVACLDAALSNQINIHLDEPESHNYGLPPRPDLLRIALDTHNYYFPEERRRMYKLTNLLFEHFQLLQYSNLNQPDFRQNWDVSYYGEEI